MSQVSTPEAPWYEGAFDKIWLRIYAHRSDEEADRESDGIVELLGLRPGARVLDVGCGAGRHARALARRGMRVTGVDLSQELLDIAREKSPHLPGKPDYLRWDARALPFRSQFVAAISMFTSFGYFDKPADDVAIFRGVARALEPGGRFLVDYLNQSHVRANLVPEDEQSLGLFNVQFRRRISDTPHGPAVFKQVEAHNPLSGALEASFEERVRLYTLTEIDAMLREAGLEPEGEPFGDVHGAPYSEEAPRLVRIARAP